MMLTLRVAILAGTLALAICSPHYNINNDIDALLVNLNELLTLKEMDTLLLPDLAEDTDPVFIGTSLRDLTTMYRTGDSEIWADGDDLKIKMNVGLKKMTVHVFLIPYLEGPGTYSFDGASAEIGLTLKPNGSGSCITNWDYLNITTLGNVITHSFNKDYDGKPAPQEITNLLIPYYNKNFNDDDIFSIKSLDRLINVCDQSPMLETYRKYHKP